MQKKYTIGLDIGTNSVGWAVVDENRHLVSKHGQTLWGVRMFEESKDASERRIYRNTRRRLKRRKERLNLLREIFSKEISKVDPTFYTRLDESFFHLEDKTVACNNLFNNYLTNKEYYDKYPTIWHLRNELIHNKEKADIRLIFLAISHIIKYRGNFLREGEFNIVDNSVIKTVLEELNKAIIETRSNFEQIEDMDLYNTYFREVEINDDLLNSLVNILVEDKEVTINNELVSNKGKTDKTRNLELLFDCNKKDKDIYKELIIPLLVKYKKDKVNKLHPINHDIGYADEGINLYSDTLDTDCHKLSNKIIELKNIFELIPNLKQITDFISLKKILGDKKYLSESFIARFNEHKKDLKDLKHIVHKYLDKDTYDKVFRIYHDKVPNYALYVGQTNSEKYNKNKLRHFEHAKYDAFIKFIKSEVINKLPQDLNAEDRKILDSINNKIENNLYLLRTNGSTNGSIPMQLHSIELKAILNNQKEYYPFLEELDQKYNISNLDKIIKIFEFKRPYYIGPLKGDNTYNWATFKKENERIYPWNFEDIVNYDESAKTFIERMQNKCTYLKGDNDLCLPKDSLAYSEYNCLNYINALSINGSRIDQETKEEIYNEIFLKYSKVTSKDIKSYLVNHKGCKEEDLNIPEVNVSMASYITMQGIFGEEFNKNRQIIEDIIRDITIFEDKKILEKRLLEIYHLDEDKVKKIKGLNYKKPGRLSSNLLCKLPIECEMGCFKGILEILREYPLTFNEILFNPEFNVNKIIDEYNRNIIKVDNDNNDPLVTFLDENITISPIYIRPFIQTMRIIDELEDILKKDNEYYYCIEVTRTNKAPKTASKSRSEQIKELLKSCDKIANEYNINIAKLESTLASNETKVADSDKFYLYFTQLGKDLYTGENIDFEEILNTTNSKYDIDHIYPQSIVKDDSLSNKVLTSKAVNNTKSNTFLCDRDGYHKTPQAKKFYKMLLEKHLITNTKYKRLTETSISDSTIEGFVARQKVATDQANKALITTLKLYKGVDDQHIIYSKAENISDFRKEYDLLKSRTANNYHHAHDAYMNAVLGKMFSDYFSDRFWLNEIRRKDEVSEEKKETTNFMKIVKYKRYKYNSNEVIWNGLDDIAIIKNNIRNRFDILETTRLNSSNAMYRKTTILKKGNGDCLVKNTTPNGNIYDKSKYGLIDSNSYSKYMIIKYIEKKKEVAKLIAVPRLFDSVNSDESFEKEKKYITNSLGIKEFSIEHPNIMTNIILEQDKTKFMITGVTNSSYVIKNAKDRKFDYNFIKIIHNIDKFNEMNEIYKGDLHPKIKLTEDGQKYILHLGKKEQYIKDGESKEYYRRDDRIISNDDLLELYDMIIDIFSKPCYAFSNIVKIKNDLNLKKGIFNTLTLKNKIKLLSELLGLLKTNDRKSADLSLIELAKNSGILKIGSTLSKGTKFISESYTGLRRKVIYEVK